MDKLQVNGKRLWDTIMETAKFGGTDKGGVCRLTLSDADRQARDWLVRECEAVGCAVSIDEMGSMFARRPGKDNTLPPITAGSHLDTQPSGGKFDGIAGVLSALCWRSLVPVIAVILPDALEETELEDLSELVEAKARRQLFPARFPLEQDLFPFRLFRTRQIRVEHVADAVEGKVPHLV